MAVHARVMSSDPTDREISAVAVGDTAEVFEEIRGVGSNLCIWRRQPRLDVARELETVTTSPLVDVRCKTSERTFSTDLDNLLSGAGLSLEMFQAWRADLTMLAGLFFPFAEGRRVELRVETTDDDGCRRYHVDRSHLRMLCTYRGPGTEWLANEQVDRTALVSGEPNERIVRFGPPARLDTFWVGLFKGSRNPDLLEGGLVHRSPPISGTGERRVLFCLDC